MKADYLSYKRAANVSLIGLIIQAVLALLLFVYSFYARDHAAMSAALFVALGGVVWLSLIILFDQHRRERIEAIEAEAMATAEASSAFDEAGEETRPASRRLANLYKFVMPAVALTLAGVLAAVGFWRLRSASALMADDAMGEPTHRGWVISIGLGLAFVGFVFARFVSGMARQDVWQHLRAGAAYAVGAAVVGLALAVAHFVDLFGPSVLVDWLPLILPWLFVVIAGEIVLVFLFDLYRPRKPGEIPALTMESRLLGFIAASDRVVESIGEALNYQFGVDISSTWFYALVRKIAPALAAVVVLAIWAMSCFVVLYPHQEALLIRNGRFVRVLEPGLHLKLPWPFDRVEIPVYRRPDPASADRTIETRTVTGIRTLDLAGPPISKDVRAVLWSEQHAPEEFYFICQPTRLRGTSFSSDADRGNRAELALVAARITLQYAISDVEKFERLAPDRMRDEVLRSVAQRAVTLYLGSRTLDDIIADDRAAIGGVLRDIVAAEFARLNPGPDGQPMGAGVDVRFVGIESAHPPQRVAPVFERVVQAEQARLALVLSAEADRIAELSRIVGSVALAEQIVAELRDLERMQEAGADDESIATQNLAIEALLAEAGGEADAIIQTARAQRWQRHMGERGRAARHIGRVEAYRAAPNLYRVREYLGALADAMRDSRVYLMTDDIPDLRIEWDLQDQDNRADIFAPDTDDEF